LNRLKIRTGKVHRGGTNTSPGSRRRRSIVCLLPEPALIRLR
jgi:hypothetical protein